MATNFISSFFSSAAFKLTNSTTGATAADGLKVSRVHIKLSSIPMRHMKEDGSTIIDSRIIQPTSVQMEAFCETLESFAKLNAVALDRSTFYSITSKGLTFENMLLENEQISQNPEVMSALPVKLSFKQVLTKSVKPIVFSQSADASLISRGMNLLSTAKTSATDLFNSISSKF